MTIRDGKVVREKEGIGSVVRWDGRRPGSGVSCGGGVGSRNENTLKS